MPGVRGEGQPDLRLMMSTRDNSIADVRHPRRPSRVLRWGLTVLLAMSIALWILSYFVSVTYSYRTSFTQSTFWQGQSITMTEFRLSGIESGELLLWFPLWHPSNMPQPRTWEFGSFLWASINPKSVWPTYLGNIASSGPIGAFVVPLWFPSASFGILAALLWRGEIRRRRFAQAKYRKKVCERFGPLLSGTLSSIIFLAALILFPVIYERFDQSANRLIDNLTEDIMRTNESLGLSILMFIWFSAAFAVAIPAFRIARWKTSYIPENQCLTCRYDLTGNVSGICPECGAVIQNQMTPSQSA